MGFSFFRLTQGTLRSEWPQALFLLLLVLLLSAILIGLVDIPGGNLQDIAFRPGVFTNAENDFVIPDLMQSADFIVLIATGLLLALALPVLTPIAASIVVVIATIPILWLGLGNPLREAEIPMQFSLLMVLMLFGMNVLISYFLDTQRKQKLIGVFGKFVPPEIVSQLSRSPELMNLDGDSRELTIFFCDLKNFTSISESLTPRQLVSLLNEYFTLMTSVLYKHGATIDKYIGDSIMAFWGAPLPQENHATLAVSAAFEMQEELERLSADLSERNLPTLSMGIGINTGIANVGNMGSTYRLAYTVIGDAVNLCARLESLTRTYKIPIVIGEETARQLQGITVRELDTVKVKGKQTPSTIFEPVGPAESLPPETRLMLKRHEEAMQLYREGSKKALSLFDELALYPDQSGYYRYMAGKLKEQLAHQITDSAEATSRAG